VLTEQPEPEAAPPERAPEPVRERVVEQTAVSTTGMWAVQLGSFSNKDNAEKLAADLRKQGYAAFLSQLSTDSGELHRVRIGPQKDRESAEAMASRLLKVGHKGQVVPHP
jgi:DedD protein